MSARAWVACAALGLGVVARADDLSVPLDPSSPDALTAGSELGAGLDPGSGQEVARPADVGALKVGLRTMGGGFASGRGSAALQLDPFLVFYGRHREYRELVRTRGPVLVRPLEDLTLTAVVAAGTPAGGEPGRSSTFGVGLASDLLGTRSPFSAAFDACVNGPGWQEQEQRLLDALPPIAERQEPGYAERRRAAEEALLAAMRAHVAECRREAYARQALFLVLGGRWVGPGQARRSGDPALAVDRQYVALSWSLPPAKGLRASAQARWIGQRLGDGGPVGTTLDAGVSVQWASRDLSLDLEATRTAAKLDRASTTASVSTTLLVQLPGSSVVVSFQLAGRGAQVGPALRHLVAAVTISYSDHEVFTKRVAER